MVNQTLFSTELIVMPTSNFQNNQRGMIKYAHQKNSIKSIATGEGWGCCLRTTDYPRLSSKTVKAFRLCYFYIKREIKCILGSRKNKSILDLSPNYGLSPMITKKNRKIFLIGKIFIIKCKTTLTKGRKVLWGRSLSEIQGQYPE